MIFRSFVLPYTQTAPGLPSRRAFWGGGARGGLERRTPAPSVLRPQLRSGVSSPGLLVYYLHSNHLDSLKYEPDHVCEPRLCPPFQSHIMVPPPASSPILHPVPKLQSACHHSPSLPCCSCLHDSIYILLSHSGKRYPHQLHVLC